MRAMQSRLALAAMVSAVMHQPQMTDKDKIVRIVDVDGAQPPPIKPNVGQAIQMSNDVIYYEEQLTIIAAEIAEAKALDKMSRFRITNRVKELLTVIKNHRKAIQYCISKHLDAAKQNKVIYSSDVHQQYIQDTKTISDMKLALFKEIRKFCVDNGYAGKR